MDKLLLELGLEAGATEADVLKAVRDLKKRLPVVRADEKEIVAKIAAGLSREQAMVVLADQALEDGNKNKK